MLSCLLAGDERRPLQLGSLSIVVLEALLVGLLEQQQDAPAVTTTTGTNIALTIYSSKQTGMIKAKQTATAPDRSQIRIQIPNNNPKSQGQSHTHKITSPVETEIKWTENIKPAPLQTNPPLTTENGYHPDPPQNPPTPQNHKPTRTSTILKKIPQLVTAKHHFERKNIPM